MSATKGVGWVDWFTFVPANREAREAGTASEVRDSFCKTSRVLVSSWALCRGASHRQVMTTLRAGLGSSVPRPRPSEPANKPVCVGDSRSGPPQGYVPLPDQAHALPHIQVFGYLQRRPKVRREQRQGVGEVKGLVSHNVAAGVRQASCKWRNAL